MNLTEAQIIEKIKQGDTFIFEFIFHKYYAGLCSYAKKLLFNHYMAEEIVLDTFAKLWEKKENLEPKSSIKFYLFRIVLNKCINYIQHQKIQNDYSSEYKYIQNNFNNDENINTERIKQFLNFIEELPEKCKQVFKMSRFDGLKYEEIAKELGISVKTVEVHISKALKYLRTKKEQLIHKYPLFKNLEK